MSENDSKNEKDKQEENKSKPIEPEVGEIDTSLGKGLTRLLKGLGTLVEIAETQKTQQGEITNPSNNMKARYNLNVTTLAKPQQAKPPPAKTENKETTPVQTAQAARPAPTAKFQKTPPAQPPAEAAEAVKPPARETVPIPLQAKTPVEINIREPNVDIYDEDGYLMITAEVPGAKQNSVKTEINGVNFSLFASDDNRLYTREILLPTKVNKQPEGISLKNGILKIRLKKENELEESL
jgi:HSP20 family molecular chaperone IbpA